MPYAIENGVCQEYQDGAVKITDAEYSEAVEAMMAGMAVTVEGGKFAIIDPPPTEEQEVEE